MKKDCEVVRDLMPLVLDDVASDGSKHMVSAHVQAAGCRRHDRQFRFTHGNLFSCYYIFAP